MTGRENKTTSTQILQQQNDDKSDGFYTVTATTLESWIILLQTAHGTFYVFPRESVKFKFYLTGKSIHVLFTLIWILTCPEECVFSSPLYIIRLKIVPRAIVSSESETRITENRKNKLYSRFILDMGKSLIRAWEFWLLAILMCGGGKGATALSYKDLVHAKMVQNDIAVNKELISASRLKRDNFVSNEIKGHHATCCFTIVLSRRVSWLIRVLAIAWF